MLSTSIGNVGMLIVNEARRSEAEAEAWTLEAEAEAEAWTLEAEAEATISGLEAEARPRGLTSLAHSNKYAIEYKLDPNIFISWREKYHRVKECSW